MLFKIVKFNEFIIKNLRYDTWYIFVGTKSTLLEFLYSYVKSKDKHTQIVSRNRFLFYSGCYKKY